MRKFLNFLWIILKWLFNILKHVILLPFYCSMSDKYNGAMYDEWLNKPDEDK